MAPRTAATLVAVSGNSRPRLELMSPPEMDEAQRAVYDAITGGPRAARAGTVPITDDAGRLAGLFAVMLLSPACRLAQVMTADRSLPDEDYEAGLAVLGQARLAELTWLVGYYAALALAVFRPALPAEFRNFAPPFDP
jgi:hypothetical protein